MEFVALAARADKELGFLTNGEMELVLVTIEVVEFVEKKSDALELLGVEDKEVVEAG